MLLPEDVAAMLRLKQAGWGSRRIARELGCSRNTVREYLRKGGWKPYKTPCRASVLDPYSELVRELFLKHQGNAAVVLQELEKRAIEVSLRTVERAVKPYRQELRALAQATLRFETRPGQQLQADFGQCTVQLAGKAAKVHLCVVTLGYSRRCFVSAWPCQRQAQWLEGIERSFRYFDGIAAELLVDNARALVEHHNLKTREVVFHPTFVAFCKHWGIEPRACAPYRARTKGKDERSVAYVKRNAIAGHDFESWEHLEQHLQWWMREVADERIHGTTGEKPIVRFDREEAAALQAIEGRPPFLMRRSFSRRVQTDCCVEVDTNHYSVPFRLVGKEVTVEVVDDELRVSFAGAEVARHPRHSGQHEWIIDPSHLDGVVRKTFSTAVRTSELQRPLDVYEALIEGAA